MSDITPTRFNPIQVLNKLTTYFGNILSDKLATKRTPVYPYKVSGGVVDGNLYSIDLILTNHTDNTTTNILLDYAATAGDTEADVLQGLAESNIDENLHIDVDTVELELSLLPVSMFSVDNNSAPVNMVQAAEPKYVSNTLPSAYNAYQNYPVGDYPFITLSLLPSTQVGAQMGHGSREVAPDTYEVFTDRYLNFSVQVTCDAGKYEDVLNSGAGGSFDVLNTLLARLDDNDLRKVIQEETNCVINPILNSVIPSPQLGDVEYHDVSSVTIDLSTVDQHISTVGTFDTVIYDADYYDFKGGNLVLQTTDGKITIDENP